MGLGKDEGDRVIACHDAAAAALGDEYPRLEARANEFGLMLVYAEDEHGNGWIFYDPEDGVETGPPWAPRRMSLDQMRRAVGELGNGYMKTPD
jgi:hypothetical protein